MNETEAEKTRVKQVFEDMSEQRRCTLPIKADYWCWIIATWLR